MQNSPLISIITPNYNCSRFIAETIESVLAQTYANWEMIIVDDCSTDKSYEIALEYAKKDERIKVIRNERNSGAAFSRNKAIEESKGEYLAFLDSDDIWENNKLEFQLDFMKRNQCDFSFTEYEHIGEDGKSLNIFANVTKKLTYSKMMFHCWPGCLTVMYKQNLNCKIYGPDIKKNNDHALFLKVLKQSENAMGIACCLAKYRIRHGSISRKKTEIIKYYVKVIHEFENKTYLFALFCVFTHVFIKTFLKYRKQR